MSRPDGVAGELGLPVYVFKEVLEWIGFLSECGPIDVFNAYHDAVSPGFVYQKNRIISHFVKNPLPFLHLLTNISTESQAGSRGYVI